MKKILFSTILSFWSMLVLAQPNMLWQNSFYLNDDDELTQEIGNSDMGPRKSFFNKVDSSLIELGILSLSGQYSRMVIQKIDKSGNTIGFNTISGITGRCDGQAILPDSLGGYWIAGSTSAIGGEVFGNNDDNDIWLVHIDSSLNMIEQIRYENELDQGLIVDFIRTDDRGYLLTQSYRTTSFLTCPYIDVQVIKFDEQFNVEWVRDLGDHFLVDEDGWDQVYDVIQTEDGGYACVGNTESSNQDEGGGGRHVWVFKLNPDGEVVWERMFSELGTSYGFGIEELADGLLFICGKSYCPDCSGAHGFEDAFLMSMDNLGNAVNLKFFGGYYADSFLEMEMLPNGHILLTGQTNSEDGDLMGMQERGGFDIWIVDCFSNWEICSQWRLGGLGGDYPTDLQVQGNEEFILVSATNSNDEWLGDVLNNPNENSINWTVKIGERVEDALSVKEQEVGIVFFPNPTSDIVHAKVPFSLIGAKYNVINAQGQWIQSSLFTSSDAVIDLSGLPSGLYSIAIPQRGWSKSILKEK